MVTDTMIENVSLEPSRKITMNLGLTYNTSVENMQLAMNILKEIASSNNSLEKDNIVSFNNYGDFSLGIIFIYYIKQG